MANPIKHPLMRYHGGKFRAAPWILNFFPSHYAYVEPFGGVASLMFQKERSKSEVYNDLDGEIVNVFRVVRDPDQCAELVRKLVFTPYSRDEFDQAYEPTDDPIESARRVIIRAEMGFGSAGATKAHTGFSCYSNREWKQKSEGWAEYPDRLMGFCMRLKGVQIENRSAIEVIALHDRKQTLYYIDPPYVLGTREMSRWKKYYRHEMEDEEHQELVDVLLGVEGMVILSGYDNDIYNDTLIGWSKFQTESRKSSNRGTKIAVETIWLNPSCSEHQKQLALL